MYVKISKWRMKRWAKKKGFYLFLKEKMMKTEKQLSIIFFEKNKLNFAVSIAATVFSSIIFLTMSLIIKDMTNAISGEAGAKSLFQILTSIMIFLGTVVCTNIILYIFKPRFIYNAINNYRNFSLDRLMKKGIDTFSRENTSVYLSAFSNDLNVIEKDYIEGFYGIIDNLISFVGAFTLMIYYSRMLTFIVIILITVPILLSGISGKRLQPVEKKISDKNIRFTAFFKDFLSGFPVVKSFKAEPEILDILKLKNGEIQQSKRKRNRIMISVNTISITASLFAQFGVFFAGVWMVVNDFKMTAGTVILFVNLMNFIVSPISQLPGLLAARKAAGLLISKLADELENNTEIDGKMEIGKLKDQIMLKDVTFSYDGKTVLKDIGLCLQKGRKYAVVGTSGAGKSTLLNVIMGANKPDSGSVSYDGMMVEDIKKDSLYSCISTIQQNVFVFDDTIINNVTMYKNFDNEKIKKALSMAKVDGMLDDKGGRYKCGENGCGLSGGEKQRISIARSLLKNSSVLLCDEITASLDKQTAYQIMSDILDIKQMTSVIVTHSLEEQILRKCDEIIVMKSGKIVEQGSFEKLLAADKYFKALYTMTE